MSDRQCPTCGWELRRIHRLPEDRALQGAEAVHRYRCKNPPCAWEGTLPVHRAGHRSRGSSAPNERLKRSLPLVLALLMAVLVTLLTVSYCLE